MRALQSQGDRCGQGADGQACPLLVLHLSPQPVAELAEKLAQIAPRGLTKTFFGNSGAEAIEGAMKLAGSTPASMNSLRSHASFSRTQLGRAQRHWQHADARSAAARMLPV